MSLVTQGGTPGGVASKKIYEFVYDFAVLGGAVAAIPLTALNGAIPAAFVITNAFVDVQTLIAGAAGTAAALSVEGANDLVSATIVAGAPWSATGLKVTIVLPATLALWIKTSQARTPAFTPSVHVVTAGKFHLFIEGFQSE